MGTRYWAERGAWSHMLHMTSLDIHGHDEVGVAAVP